MNKELDRMKQLVNILNNASIEYYQHSNIIMTDFEYDKLYDELVELERKTNTTLSNSPTINVETEILSNLEKKEHPSPMLSLSKTKSIDDLIEFISDKEGLLSWKLDGLTIVLTYDKGKLISGVTRGNGIIGEVVTNNVKRFKNIPTTISYKGKLVLRGEAVIKYSDFKKMNEQLDEESDEYKNPRNLCSGSVRQLDSNITAKRNVNCIIFSLISSEDFISDNKLECFDFLKKQGFDVVESYEVNKDNIKDTVLMFKDKIKNFDIPSDGLVLTFKSNKYSSSLKSTAKSPKHSIAFKWLDETKETTLINIDWLTSRTGLINPVAVFTPIELEGTIVSRASVHNISILKGLKLGINDRILVYKANMIIPQIAENLTRSNNIIIPTKCPVCGEKTEIKSTEKVSYLYCTNEFCKAKLIKKLSLFVSRNAMNIEGVSDQILDKFITENLLTDYTDLYHLEQYKDIIINYEGFGEKSYNNIINSINKSRKTHIANFIYALGIKDIGKERAKLICKHFNNDINKIKNLTIEQLSIIDGVGEIIAKEWINEFNNEKFINNFNQLLKEIEFTDTKNNKEQKLSGLTFVITGSLNNYTNRDELIEYIESLGGKTTTSISKNVDYLINNDILSTSSKNKKAKELNIKIITEEEFLKLSTN